MQQTPAGILVPEGSLEPVSVGALPCAAGEERYCATREKVATWRQQAMNRQQWRRDSALAIEYWDGNQFPAELAEKLKARGIPMVTHNMIKKWVNSVIGTMERNQTDGLVKMEDDRLEELGTAMTQRLKEAERMTRADRACLNAMGYAIKGGLGWVEVGESDDPFAYPDRVESINWREIDWDPGAMKEDFSDSQWFRRTRFFNRQMLEMAMPEQAEIIRQAGTTHDVLGWYEPERMERAQDFWRDSSRWTDAGRHQDSVTLSEFRYAVTMSGYVMRTPGGVQPFDEHNPEHLAMYQSGQVQPMPAIYRRWRQAYWLGPHCLVDRWNPRPDNEVGWVPFVCYIEDRTGAPYGLVRDMLSLQDEINATKAKMHWSMDSTTIIGDSNRVLNWDDARAAVNRRDGVIMLDGKNPQGRFELDRHQGISQWQLLAYQDAVAKIGQVHGLENPIAGGRESGQSGISQQVQIDQSLTCVGKPLNHYKEARQKVLSLLLNQQIARMGSDPQTLDYKDPNGRRAQVQVNVPVQLEEGAEPVKLSLAEIKRNVVLDDTPSTPTYRSQQFLQIVDTLRSMPPEAQKLLVPAMFEMSELPNKQAYADMARKMLGLTGPETPEEQEDAAKQKQLADMMAELQVALVEVKTMREKAQADKTTAETQAIQQDMQAQAVALAATGGVPGKQQAVYRW